MGLSVAQNGLSLKRSMPPTPFGPSRLLRSIVIAGRRLDGTGFGRPAWPSIKRRWKSSHLVPMDSAPDHSRRSPAERGEPIADLLLAPANYMRCHSALLGLPSRLVHRARIADSRAAQGWSRRNQMRC